MRKIYLASSWRNTVYNDILYLLRQVGHEVYDFRNPGAEKKNYQGDDHQAHKFRGGGEAGGLAQGEESCGKIRQSDISQGVRTN